ncbi:MAG: hypothetical protein ACOY4I_13925 [Bacillota bacterium]
MDFKGNCLTTAMGILPHKNIQEALDLALTLDIPFWPQLPYYSYYEDMYVQVSENFPGIIVDTDQKRITLDSSRFYEELGDYAVKSDDVNIFKLSPLYSLAFDAFMERDLSGYHAIRGQSIGPVSFGLKIADENLKPIIYNDDVREFLFEFIAQKINIQYRQLREKHPNTFVWVDEPGLEIIFGSFTGYPSLLKDLGRPGAAFLHLYYFQGKVIFDILPTSTGCSIRTWTAAQMVLFIKYCKGGLKKYKFVPLRPEII